MDERTQQIHAHHLNNRIRKTFSSIIFCVYVWGGGYRNHYNQNQSFTDIHTKNAKVQRFIQQHDGKTLHYENQSKQTTQFK